MLPHAGVFYIFRSRNCVFCEGEKNSLMRDIERCDQERWKVMQWALDRAPAHRGFGRQLDLYMLENTWSKRPKRLNFQDTQDYLVHTVVICSAHRTQRTPYCHCPPAWSGPRRPFISWRHVAVHKKHLPRRRKKTAAHNCSIMIIMAYYGIVFVSWELRFYMILLFPRG